MDKQDQLSEFGTKIQAVPEEESTVKTAFDIFEENTETGWQKYLVYFLDPSESHGLNGDFLWRIIDQLEELDRVSSSPSERSLKRGTEILVKPEYQSKEEKNRPDIILTHGTDWFLCIELKLHAPENTSGDPQTVRYAKDKEIVPKGKDAYQEGEYVYIKRASAQESQSEEFEDVNWEELLPAVRETIGAQAGDVPMQTAAQLSAFETAIKKELLMSDINESTKLKKDLYFEYHKQIQDAEKAVGDFVDDVLKKNWSSKLDSDYAPETEQDFNWEYDNIGNRFGKIRLENWPGNDGGENEGLDIHWEHKINKANFIDGSLTFRLEFHKPDEENDTELMNQYTNIKKGIEDEISNKFGEARTKPETGRWENEDITSNTEKIIRKFEYTYQSGDEDGLYKCLKFALEDTEKITGIVSTVLEEELDA